MNIFIHSFLNVVLARTGVIPIRASVKGYFYNFTFVVDFRAQSLDYIFT
jgi:hypothetical protein